MALLDGLFAAVFRGKEDQIVRRLAGEVARQCRAALRNRVSRRSHGMSPAMLRGYIRAYAAALVAAEAAAAVTECGANVHLRSRVIDAATEQLVRVVCRDLLSARFAAQGRAAAA